MGDKLVNCFEEDVLDNYIQFLEAKLSKINMLETHFRLKPLLLVQMYIISINLMSSNSSRLISAYAFVLRKLFFIPIHVLDHNFKTYLLFAE